ncbi:MAG: C39 family peptidase [Faecalibacterium sp.]|jgi:uncharacterized protein YvpB|nr:C39 family peptidase [Faecalibacterium sp.]
MKKILQAPYIDQTERWVYGCESVSAVMLLQYLGVAIGPDTFIDEYLPRAQSTTQNGEMLAENPAYYYINNPRDTTGWGCYAPCICTALKNALAAGGKGEAYTVVDASGKTAEALCREFIDQGMPVVFWATLDFEPSVGTDRWRLPDGQEFIWKNHEHCLLLVGYDEENYWFNDPWHNHGCCPYPKALVEQRHREQDLYAVSLKPNL